MSDCVFCQIVHEQTDTHILSKSPLSVAFEPLNPVTPGHVLVVPIPHAARLEELSPDVLGDAVELASSIWQGSDYNLIQSNGRLATQTIDHVHFHVVPRRENDNLLLPWSYQHYVQRWVSGAGDFESLTPVDMTMEGMRAAGASDPPAVCVVCGEQPCVCIKGAS